MNEKIKDVVNKATDYTGSTKRKVGKGILGVIIVLLLGALGLEVGNKDLDIESVLGGNSVNDSTIIRDENGNLKQDAEGNFITKVIRDIEGNELPSGSTNGKFTDEYNCEDFKTKADAQKFFQNAGGLSSDTNRLDGDKDGEACESLPNN